MTLTVRELAIEPLVDLLGSIQQRVRCRLAAHFRSSSDYVQRNRSQATRSSPLRHAHAKRPDDYERRGERPRYHVHCGSGHERRQVSPGCTLEGKLSLNASSCRCSGSFRLGLRAGMTNRLNPRCTGGAQNRLRLGLFGGCRHAHRQDQCSLPCIRVAAFLL